jgi:hypothetical protein
MSNIKTEINKIKEKLVAAGLLTNEDLEIKVKEAIERINKLNDVVPDISSNKKFSGYIKLRTVLYTVLDCIVPVAMKLQVDQLEALLSTLEPSESGSSPSQAGLLGEYTSEDSPEMENGPPRGS